jgi:RNA recognition motif-containing protein
MRAPIFHGNIVVSNLPDGFSAVQLAALFDEFGLVLGAEIDRTRRDRGSVILAPEPAVDKAIAMLSGQIIAAKKVKVVRAPAPQRRERPASMHNGAPSERPRSPEQIQEAIRKFRGSSDPASATPVPPAAPARQVVVEYRKTRRIEIPRRAPLASRSGAAVSADPRPLAAIDG